MGSRRMSGVVCRSFRPADDVGRKKTRGSACGGMQVVGGLGGAHAATSGNGCVCVTKPCVPSRLERYTAPPWRTLEPPHCLHANSAERAAPRKRRRTVDPSSAANRRFTSVEQSRHIANSRAPIRAIVYLLRRLRPEVLQRAESKRDNLSRSVVKTQGAHVQ